MWLKIRVVSFAGCAILIYDIMLFNLSFPRILCHIGAFSSGYQKNQCQINTDKTHCLYFLTIFIKHGGTRKYFITYSVRWIFELNIF